jgi:hypothetical protein
MSQMFLICFGVLSCDRNGPRGPRKRGGVGEDGIVLSHRRMLSE